MQDDRSRRRPERPRPILRGRRDQTERRCSRSRWRTAAGRSCRHWIHPRHREGTDPPAPSTTGQRSHGRSPPPGRRTPPTRASQPPPPQKVSASSRLPLDPPIRSTGDGNTKRRYDRREAAPSEALHVDAFRPPTRKPAAGPTPEHEGKKGRPGGTWAAAQVASGLYATKRGWRPLILATG